MKGKLEQGKPKYSEKPSGLITELLPGHSCFHSCSLIFLTALFWLLGILPYVAYIYMVFWWLTLLPFIICLSGIKEGWGPQAVGWSYKPSLILFRLGCHCWTHHLLSGLSCIKEKWMIVIRISFCLFITISFRGLLVYITLHVFLFVVFHYGNPLACLFFFMFIILDAAVLRIHH